MPILTKEEACEIAKSKFENALFVGTYDQVRSEAQRRANESGGSWFTTVRIDDAEYSEEYKRWDMINDPMVNDNGFFWFALLPAGDPDKEEES